MSLFGPYHYTNKKGEKFWLHMRQKGKRTLYYFSKDPTGAINDLPKGFEVFENEKSGLPMIRKKSPLDFFSKGKDILEKVKKEK